MDVDIQGSGVKGGDEAVPVAFEGSDQALRPNQRPERGLRNGRVEGPKEIGHDGSIGAGRGMVNVSLDHILDVLDIERDLNHPLVGH
jgi:hypothetical protein